MGVQEDREMAGTKSCSLYWEINTFVKVKAHNPCCASGPSKCQRKSVPKDGELHTGESRWCI